MPDLEQLHAMVRGMVVILDRRGKIAFVNDFGAQLLGWTREELTGADWFDTCLPARLQDDVRAGFRLLIAGEMKPLEYYENPVLAKDGREVPVRWHNSPLEKDGRIEGTFSLGVPGDPQPVDASSRLRAELYAELFDRAPVGYLAVRGDGSVRLANEKAASMLGYQVEELCDRALSDLLVEGGGDEEDAVERPGQLTRADGSPLWVRLTGHAVGDEVRVGFVDVSELRKVEQTLAEKAADLERSNLALRQFAYAASHDLKEPLRTISSFLGLLRQDTAGTLAPEVDEYIGIVVDAATRMRALIDSLLEYSRVSVREARRQPVPVRDVLDEAVANLRMAISETGANIDIGELPTVSGDRTMLVQLLQNLVGNALKFRGETKPEVRVRAERDPEGWRLSVGDNGIGIEPEHADQIFDVFGRLHSQAEYPGFGVGLSICKQIAESHGGRIWVESSPGVGATFVFTLPDADSPPTRDSDL